MTNPKHTKGELSYTLHGLWSGSIKIPSKEPVKSISGPDVDFLRLSLSCGEHAMYGNEFEAVIKALVHRWNCHDELVAACRGTVSALDTFGYVDPLAEDSLKSAIALADSDQKEGE